MAKKPETANAVDLIADHFTGALVAHNSICLQLPAPHSTMARTDHDQLAGRQSP